MTRENSFPFVENRIFNSSSRDSSNGVYISNIPFVGRSAIEGRRIRSFDKVG